MTSYRLHPLAAVILAPLGTFLLADCGSTADGCPETTTRTESFGDGCEIELTSEQLADEECFTITLDEGGVCPAVDDERFQQMLQDAEIYNPVRCGPRGPAGPPDSGQRVAAAVGAGGAGSGGDDPIGTGGADASGGGGQGGVGDGGAHDGGADVASSSVASSSVASTGTGEPASTLGSCCYIVVGGEYCIGGRPFLVAGAPRVAPTALRSDWTMSMAASEPDAASGDVFDETLPESARVAIASAWLRDAAYEHASVAAFARFTLELLAVGAPPDLVEEAHRAGLDEIHHARLCYGLAARFGGGDIRGPGALTVGDAVIAGSLAEMVVGVIREGCVGETIAALIATRALEGVSDPAVRAALEVIARDEARHASLAWHFVAWAVRVGGAEVRQSAREEIARALAGVPEDDGVVDGAEAGVLRACGRLSAVERRAVAVEALREVVGPCAERVLGAGAAAVSPSVSTAAIP